MPIEERLADEARFFRSWLDNPAIAGAVSPSGRFLARMMARYVDPQKAGPIIELGPGTGAITEALLERGIAPGRLFLVEFDPGFCKLLKRRFPGIHVIKGDAYNLTETLGNRLRRPPAAIVSSLPLLLKPEVQRLALLADAFQCMTPDGCFVQFTYGPLSPIPRDKTSELAFHVEASPPVWLNSAAGARLDLPASAAGSQWGGATAVESGAGISRQAETRNRENSSRLEERNCRCQGQASTRTETRTNFATGTKAGSALTSARGKASGIDNSHHL